MTELDPLIRRFYRERYVEDGRLERTGSGRLEFLRTQELLRRVLPQAPAKVLDVGGATGVHARWLAKDGYAVHLVDAVEEHVEHARTIGGFTAAVGDARALVEADASADGTLLLGPLYHLMEVADRALALREAVRVTRPGGVVVGAAISRYAGLVEYGSSGALTDDLRARFADVLATGRHQDDPDGFTNAYFHHADELAAEFRAAGLSDVEVFGVEGPAAATLHFAGREQAETLLPAALRLARMVERDPAVLATSFHFLAVGRVGQ